MTRETRIGLLIGLGFIVLFGVVLAGLLNTNDKLPAPVAASGNSTLAFDPIREEVAPPKPEAPIVAIRSNDTVPVVTPAEPVRVVVAPAGPTPEVQVAVEGPGERIARTDAATARDIVRDREELRTAPAPTPIPVLVAGGMPTVTPVTPDHMPTGPAIASTDRVPSLKYKIAAGDTLGKLAAKFYGHSSEYKLILTANSSLRDATSLKIGQEIVIPPPPVRTAVAPTTPTAVPATPAVPAMPAVTTVAVRPTDAPSLRRALAGARGATLPASRTTAPETTSGTPEPRALVAEPAMDLTPSSTSGVAIADRMRATMSGSPLSPTAPPTDASAKKVYKIQQGDTLSKIASKMMNDNSRASIQKLLDLNKSKIANPTSLKIGVTLEIPS